MSVHNTVLVYSCMCVLHLLQPLWSQNQTYFSAHHRIHCWINWLNSGLWLIHCSSFFILSPFFYFWWEVEPTSRDQDVQSKVCVKLKFIWRDHQEFHDDSRDPFRGYNFWWSSQRYRCLRMSRSPRGRTAGNNEPTEQKWISVIRLYTAEDLYCGITFPILTIGMAALTRGPCNLTATAVITLSFRKTLMKLGRVVQNMTAVVWTSVWLAGVLRYLLTQVTAWSPECLRTKVFSPWCNDYFLGSIRELKNIEQAPFCVSGNVPASLLKC